MVENKRCPRCGEVKPLTDWSRNRSQRSGYGTYCKPCHNEVVRNNRIKHYGSTRSFHLNRRYGVDSVTIEWLLLRQGYVCAICGSPDPSHVDHDHQSKNVRGILCFNCDRGLGKFDDSVSLMRKAIEYLTKAQTKQ